jgi:hypothetical protein
MSTLVAAIFTMVSVGADGSFAKGLPVSRSFTTLMQEGGGEGGAKKSPAKKNGGDDEGEEDGGAKKKPPAAKKGGEGDGEGGGEKKKTVTPKTGGGEGEEGGGKKKTATPKKGGEEGGEGGGEKKKTVQGASKPANNPTDPGKSADKPVPAPVSSDDKPIPTNDKVVTGTDKAPSLVGRVLSVFPEGENTLVTLRVPKTGEVAIRITKETVVAYFDIPNKADEKPTVGYIGYVWIKDGSTDAAANVRFTVEKPVPTGSSSDKK